MTAPTFVKKRIDTAVDPTSVKYGAPDWTKFVDVLDATHATERIQADVIEGYNLSYNIVVYISGTTIFARRTDGTVISTGVAGTDDGTVIQNALNEGGTTATKTPTT